MFSFDLNDGFYALGIVPEERDFLTVHVRGQLYRLVGLPMGWSLSPYHFCAFTYTFVRHLRQPDPGGFTRGEACAARRRQTEQAFPTTYAVARSKSLTLCRRLPPLRSHPSARSSAPSARRPPPHQPRPSSPSLQRFLGADAIRLPHGNRHRHSNMLLLRPNNKTSKARQTSPATTVTCYTSQQVAPCQGTPIIRSSGAVPFSRYPSCTILPARTALRTRRQVGRPSTPHPSAPSRPAVVDPCTQPRKWQEHPPPGRVGLHTLRQFGVWLGSSTKRQTRSTQLLRTKGRTPEHCLEGIEGRPSGRPHLLASSRWPQRPHPRGQPGGLLRLGRLDLPLPGNEDRITPTMVHVGHQQHSHKTPVHPVRGEHVGKQAQPPPQQRQLAARPLSVSRNKHSIRPAHDRLVCVGSQHTTSPLQRKLARPIVRSSGLPSPRRFVMCNPPWPLLPDLAQKLQHNGGAATVHPPVGKEKRGTMHLSS
jgi:hypothetical protein